MCTQLQVFFVVRSLKLNMWKILRGSGFAKKQCCGSMTFWCGSWSVDPSLWLIDLDPGSGSCYFHHWPLRCQPKTNFFKNFLCLLLFEGTFTVLHNFSKIKSPKESQNSRNPGFSYYFCMMIEGSGSGSIPLINGSGSRRTKNILIRIRIRIRNTAKSTLPVSCSDIQ